jgi:hypothetical protein
MMFPLDSAVKLIKPVKSGLTGESGGVTMACT